MIRDFTRALGAPGIIRTKSTTNSVCEWVIIAKLLYTPLSHILSQLYIDLVLILIFHVV